MPDAFAIAVLLVANTYSTYNGIDRKSQHQMRSLQAMQNKMHDLPCPDAVGSKHPKDRRPMLRSEGRGQFGGMAYSRAYPCLVARSLAKSASNFERAWSSFV